MTKNDFIYLYLGLTRLDDDDAASLRNFKSYVTYLQDSLNEGDVPNFTLDYYVQQLANATSCDQVKNVLMPYWNQPNVPMINVYQYFLALNQLVQQFDGIKDPVFFNLTLHECTVEISYRRLETDDDHDSESIAEEASVATEEDLTKELKIAEEDFKKATEMIASNQSRILQLRK